ncbi:hypothetical protein SLEP1_g102 [Rubroshorea leprosula]|uniref:RING-type E3 ubiquitin transferase n=1 Tax=Rubroshorea leprosula TaxID=152421 RepID=A0AAV5HG13_9ROSI|nr:hypothetical protein SLEP1_g102 [Rubroshorea leprosula]
MEPPYVNRYQGNSDQGYEMSGRIMLCALVVLFFVVVIVFALHLYARWFILRARRRHLVAHRRGVGRTRVVFYVDSDYNPATTVSRGLEARVLRSLPVFTYSAETHPDSVMECAVCLSEFEENESGRILPKCKHSFHTECIDMWFYSHSTCPLCRAPVEEYKPTPTNPGDVALTVHESAGVESGSVSASGMYAACEQVGSPSFGGRRKLSLEVPRRSSEGFEGESSSYRSPMSRMLSFKRILSRERRQSPCASPRTVTIIESDTRRGESPV